MLIKTTGRGPDYGKNLIQRRWAFLALLAVGATGLVCYFFLVPVSGISGHARGFYLGGASGITGAALANLLRNEWMLRHPERWKKARIQETDERSQRLTAQAAQLGHQVLIDLAAQHHLDDIHGFTIGVAQTVDKLALLADLSQHFIDLRAAAVYDNDLDADQIEQYQIVDDRVLQLLIDHCVTAVFYDNGLTVIFLNIRKRFDQNIGTQLRIKLSIHTNSFLYREFSSFLRIKFCNHR